MPCPGSKLRLSAKEHFNSVRDSDSMSDCVWNESRKIVLTQFAAKRYSVATLLQAVVAKVLKGLSVLLPGMTRKLKGTLLISSTTMLSIISPFS